MNPIDAVFVRLRAAKKKALIPYITAGDPDLAGTAKALDFFARSGADIIELGVPFSDPMADGPVIQAAMERALKSGTTLRKVLAVVREFRRTHATPVILMGYCNPFWAFGVDRFAKEAAAAGVNGVLTVDLPPEEAGDFCASMGRNGITPVFLATPVTDERRLSIIGPVARGFVYFVSVTGVTGERTALPAGTKTRIDKIRKTIGLPVVLGFGISGPDVIHAFYGHADGFVVGSAIVKRWHAAQAGGAAADEFAAFFGGLERACHGAGTGQ